MKILIVHNFYQSSFPSGEDIVFKNEVELLKRNGIEVITYIEHNDRIKEYGLWGRFILPFTNIWSLKTYRKLRQVLKKEKPDIAHFHNIWYLISPSAYYACKDEGVPVIQTLHNFRIFCANGLLMREGRICEECIIKVKTGNRLEVIGDRLKIVKNALKYGCYRNSRLYSLPVAFTEYFHWAKKTWINKVDEYIALTEFGKNKFVEAGLPAEKIFVKPNFLPNPPEPNYSHQNYACFIGRISEEKGVDLLIEAFKLLRNSQFKLKIIGDGPLRNHFEEKIKKEGINGIEFLGRKEHLESIEILKNAKFLMLPSIWYEMFPVTLIEAFACGKPVVASNLGVFAELVQDGITGLLFEVGNVEDLAEKIEWMIGNDCLEMGKNARELFEERYSERKNFEILMEIYNKISMREIRKIEEVPYSMSGINIYPVGLKEALNIVLRHIKDKNGDYFCFVNAHLVTEGYKDQNVKEVLNRSTGNFSDGMGVAWTLKLLGAKFKDRVRGADFMMNLCSYAAENGLKIFLYGSTEENLLILKEKLVKLFPELKIVGTISPPFRELTPEEDSKFIEQINNSEADILFVSLGAPKQEKWMAEHKGRLKPVQLGVGAAFDFIAGTKRGAPKWVQKIGLEWLWRLIHEPRRLWKRYLIGNTIFIWLVLKEFLKGRLRRKRNL